MTVKSLPHIRVTPLDFADEIMDRIDLPGGVLEVVRGIGSGLTRLPGDPPNRIWAIGDRGPNFKVPLAVKRYGLKHLKALAGTDGIKVMPIPTIGPVLSELRLDGDTVTCVRTLPLRDRNGKAISGLPIANGLGETAIDLDGNSVAPDPSGADSEGIAAMADGTFWVADEYGPSLLRVAPDGTVVVRWVPQGYGHLFDNAEYPVIEALPAIAGRRQFNRGFEAVALSPDDAWLYVAFQSPLAHPDERAHRHGRHVRIWKLTTQTGAVAAQFLYPLDKPASFRRDCALGAFHRADLKVSELVCLGPDRLLVLERGSATSKFYTVTLDARCAIDHAHLDVTTRPTVEELSAADQVDFPLPQLAKSLVLTTDDFPDIDADLEGVVMLDPRTILVVNDNDFGVEGVATHFWRIDLPHDI